MTCVCGHDDHDSSDIGDYPQQGRCRTAGCRCRSFLRQPPPWREQAGRGWTAYWREVGARGGAARWAGWIAGSLLSTAGYELLKGAARLLLGR